MLLRVRNNERRCNWRHQQSLVRFGAIDKGRLGKHWIVVQASKEISWPHGRAPEHRNDSWSVWLNRTRFYHCQKGNIRDATKRWLYSQWNNVHNSHGFTGLLPWPQRRIEDEERIRKISLLLNCKSRPQFPTQKSSDKIEIQKSKGDLWRFQQSMKVCHL